LKRVGFNHRVSRVYKGRRFKPPDETFQASEVLESVISAWLVARGFRKRSRCRWNVSRRLFCTITEKETFHLSSQILPSAKIRQIQAVFIDEHGLMFEPELPSLLADLVVYALAQFAGVGGIVESLGRLLEVDAFDRS
jgi:hypothetical protein